MQDLVKKHLMLAVRDEVDVLKERIVELQVEVDVMKGMLTPEQLAQIQSILNKSVSTDYESSLNVISVIFFSLLEL